MISLARFLRLRCFAVPGRALLPAALLSFPFLASFRCLVLAVQLRVTRVRSERWRDAAILVAALEAQVVAVRRRLHHVVVVLHNRVPLSLGCPGWHVDLVQVLQTLLLDRLGEGYPFSPVRIMPPSQLGVGVLERF